VKTGTDRHARHLRARDEKRRRLEDDCHFAFCTQRSTYAEIGVRFNLHRETVAAYVAAAAQRIASDTSGADLRAIHFQQNITYYSAVARHYFEKMTGPNPRGDEGRFVVAACVAIDKLVGNRTTHLAVETPLAPPFTGPANSDNVTRILRMAIAAKPAADAAERS
jgi:hypothetical protein